MQRVTPKRLWPAIALVGLCVSLTAATGGTSAEGGGGATRNGLIAFMRPGTVGDYDVWAVRPDGTRLRRLTRSPLGRDDHNPVWSPDGTTVLFERRRDNESAAGGDEALYTVDAYGGHFHQVTHCSGTCWSDSDPSWSDDGTQIAYSRATGPRTADAPALVAIAIANADGAAARTVSTPPSGFEDHYPTWSPDGGTIVFQRDWSGDPARASMLVAVNVETGAEQVVYTLPPWAPNAGIPKFAPNGKLILFSFWCAFEPCPPGSRSARTSRLATIRPDGTGLRVLQLKALGDTGTWSPDGTTITYRCQPKTGLAEGDFRLCTTKPDGTQFKRFPWKLNSTHPDWGTHP
jgi:dipeptidyl aminopeptidase/acylaminoacyl peptidase